MSEAFRCDGYGVVFCSLLQGEPGRRELAFMDAHQQFAVLLIVDEIKMQSRRDDNVRVFARPGDGWRAKSKRAACRQIASSRSGGFKLIERALWRARRTKLGALSSENTVLAEPVPRASPTSGRSFSMGAPVRQFGQALSASVIWAMGGPSCVATICIQSPTKRCKAQIVQKLKTGLDP